MTISEITTLLNSKRKGTFLRIGWKSDNIASAKAQKLGIVVEKYVEVTARWGIKYENTKKAKAKEAARTEEKKKWTPWYHHIDKTPYLIKHNTKEETYIQLYPLDRKNLMKVKYYINGTEKTKDEVRDSGYVNASTLDSKTDDTNMITVKLKNIEFIGRRI